MISQPPKIEIQRSMRKNFRLLTCFCQISTANPGDFFKHPALVSTCGIDERVTPSFWE
jgi:hypothetical protein